MVTRREVGLKNNKPSPTIGSTTPHTVLKIDLEKGWGWRLSGDVNFPRMQTIGEESQLSQAIKDH